MGGQSREEVQFQEERGGGGGIVEKSNSLAHKRFPIWQLRPAVRIDFYNFRDYCHGYSDALLFLDDPKSFAPAVP